MTIADNTIIGPHAILRTGTRVGPGCRIGPGVIVAEPPMDTAFQGEPSQVILGAGNDLREYVTIHRATGRGKATCIGDGNLIMAYVHVAHNCRVGNQVTITNGCQLGGHVEIQDRAVIGGMTGIHQFVRVGAYAMVGACSYLNQDVPPFLLGAGNPFRLRGLNAVGLRRAGFSPTRIAVLRRLYRTVYRSRLGLRAALRELAQTFPKSPDVRRFLDFAESSRRGVLLKSGESAL